MQTQLNNIPSENLSVYTVWLAMLGGDSRDDWDIRSMPDPRVMHFWDGEYITGRWFARQVDGYEGIAWDIYYLYGPDAIWDSVPSPLIGSGRTIYDERESLKMQLSNLIVP